MGSLVPNVSKKMTSFMGQASWTKMMPSLGKLTALPCHTTKKVNKTEEITYLSTNIAINHFPPG